MSYIEKNLMNGENILHQGNLHWIVFYRAIIWFIVSIILFSGNSDTASLGGMFVLIAIGTGIVSFLNYKTSEFGITNKRVIVKAGFIRRNSLEVLLNKVEGIKVSQGILGRILDFGSITVSGTGGTKDPFQMISAPLEFRRKIQEQIDFIHNSK